MDFLGFKGRQQKKDFNREVDLAVAVTLERFASATAQHFVSYPDLQEQAAKRISSNPVDAANNYHQQSGFSAEVKTVARVNAENLIDGKPQRIARTSKLGMGNHPSFDHVEVGTDGVALKDSQGNFVGGSQQKVHKSIGGYQKLYSGDFDRYKDASLDVPSDQLSAIQADWDAQARLLEKQRSNRLAAGDADQARQLDDRIERIRHARARLCDSRVSTTDAMEARKAPLLSAGKDVARVAHRAGISAAKTGATIAGSVNGLRNLAAWCREEKDTSEAVGDAVVCTVKATSVSYATAAASSVVGGALKASSREIVQNLAKKNGPTAIVQTGAILAKQTVKLMSGEITAAEFVQAVGQEGASLASSITGSNLGAVVGTAVMPGVGTVVGGVIGGIVASIMSGSVYCELQRSIRDTAISEQRRKAVREVCERLIEQERQNRQDVASVLDRFLSQTDGEIMYGFECMSQAIQNGQSIQPGLARVGSACGIGLRFGSFDELTKHVESGQSLKL